MICLPPLAAEEAPATERTPLQLNFEQRVRNENWNNLFDFSDAANDQRNQIRYRTRVWLDAPLPFSIDAHIGLAQETNQKFGSDNRFDEVFFDTAYLDFRRLFSNRLTLRIGRQDFMKGEGFILSEGGPLDGTRALYFNGFDLTYVSPAGQFELIGISNPGKDRYLPRFHDRQRALVEWNDQAIGLYYTKRLPAKSSVEAYYFIKKELHDCRPPGSPLFQPDRRVNTVGARATQTMTPRLTAAAEFAVQRGVQAPDTSVRGWGGYGYVRRGFNGRLKPYLKAGYWALSGGSRPGDGWDPLFSRGGSFGDLNLYSTLNERGIGYLSNLKMAQLEAGFASRQGVSYRFVYEHLSAFRPAGISPQIFGSGCDRGDNLQARVHFTLNEHLRGHVDFETQFPGSFYADRGRAYFLRFEMIWQSKLRIASSKLQASR